MSKQNKKMKTQNLLSLKLGLLLVLLVCSFVNIKAQDKIILHGGDTIEVKISKISAKSISYHLSNYADGPLYEVNHSGVSKIIYPNGEEIAFEDGFGPGTQLFNNHKNSIEIITTEIIAGRASLAYSRQIGNHFEARIQGAYSFQDNFNLEHYGGLQFLYHPLGFRKVDYYFGLGTRIGSMSFYQPYYTEVNGLIYYDNSVPRKTTAATLEIVNGFKLNLNQRFAFNFGFTAGALTTESSYSDIIISGFIGTAFRF